MANRIKGITVEIGGNVYASTNKSTVGVDVHDVEFNKFIAIEELEFREI